MADGLEIEAPLLADGAGIQAPPADVTLPLGRPAAASTVDFCNVTLRRGLLRSGGAVLKGVSGR